MWKIEETRHAAKPSIVRMAREYYKTSKHSSPYCKNDLLIDLLYFRESEDFDDTTTALRIVTEAAEHANTNVSIQVLYNTYS